MLDSSENIYQETYQIISPIINPMGYLGLYGVLNLLQDTAWAHANIIAKGQPIMSRDDLIWVFTRQKLKMKEWPRFGSKLTVKTWIREPEGAFVGRNFLVLDESGTEVGSSAASFLAIDKIQKRILPVSELMEWKKFANAQTLDYAAEKVPVRGEYEKLAKFRVRNSDLDGNQHVNNTKYAQWILDAVPFSLHKELKLTGYAVNFLVETHLGDELEIFRSNTPPASPNAGSTFYKGVRVSDEKILFTATVDWEKR